MADLEPSARVIADSISPEGRRLTTLEVVMHRFVLAEFNTHRAFSRNSSSSRAIPVSRTLARLTTPAVPLSWPREQKGMQGGDEIDNPAQARDVWLAARDDAIRHARRLADLGVHKSVVNRLVEPFMDHTVVVTATDWDGFWQQRRSPLAQPEIRAVADAMYAAWYGSLPLPVDYMDWHLPYITDADKAEIPPERWQAVSAARCARTSYLTHAGHRDWTADDTLYRKLRSAQPPHWSPMEHVATPAYPGEIVPGNLTGWHSLRHLPEIAGI